MRSYEDAAKCWPELNKLATLSDLKKAVKDSRFDYTPILGLRSVFWKTFLLFESVDRATWPKRLQNSRAAYTSLRTHFLRSIEHPDELETAIDPLSESEESPWTALRQDEALRAEILQDVDRCMPENLYFRQPTTQNMLLDILFVFSKLNPDVSYRQGMHELLAPILWVVERDAIAQDAPRRGQDHEICTIFDSKFIEHDTFTLFGLIMQSAKTFYEAGSDPGRSVDAKSEAPIVLICRRVFEDYLPRIDPDLASHLHEIGILPQVFLMRWVRLLFGREFPFDDMLQMWDVIFAEDPTLSIVDIVCIVMLLRIRWQLIEADYSTALTLLLRYPEPPDSHGAKSFVTDAVFLKTHFHSDGGSHIVHKHTGRHLPLVSRAGTVSESPDIPTFTVTERSRSPPSTPKRAMPPAGLEGLLQDAARGVFKRGEKWGVNQAVRDAVGEVRKNVQSLQGGRITPQRNRSMSSKSSTDADKLLRKVSQLEERNKALAKMLEGAVAELWDHQKSVSETTKPEGDSVNALSMAIARVQFVQVYLEDSSMALPEEDNNSTAKTSPRKETPSPAPAPNPPPDAARSKSNAAQPAEHDAEESSATPNAERPSSPPPPSEPRSALPASRPKPAPVSLMAHSAPTPSTAPPTRTSFSPAPSHSPPPPTSANSLAVAPHTNLNLSRPSLAQSSFSWMLGDNVGDDEGKVERRGSGSTGFAASRPFVEEKKKKEQQQQQQMKGRRGRGRDGKTDFLFGEGEEGEGEGREVFDLGEVGREGGPG
ncbi:MAG: hypothetical protein M1822_006647 [Bathelium mastoideum]|nr:MAG: hypothetical protein M1822_006647 [Bathelium mastoideum]